MLKVGLNIDHELCWGCKTCEVACKQENRTADGIKLIHISEDGPKIIDGKWTFFYLVNICRHCDDPPCMEACPDEAIFKRDDGIVVMNDDNCTGCGACQDVCPYDAIAFNEEQRVAQKCNLCYHRVDKGLLPACADNVCLAHCIHFNASDKVE